MLHFVNTNLFHLSSFEPSGKFQTEIGKSWAAEINSRRNSRLANRHNWSWFSISFFFPSYQVEPISEYKDWILDCSITWNHFFHVFECGRTTSYVGATKKIQHIDNRSTKAVKRSYVSCGGSLLSSSVIFFSFLSCIW